ncbi:MAG: Rieske 2Fe-2S domain-containing protein [Gemmataceae bacterium]|nr:Rieske 2Fe-2S domain-containing protein [Gemmataceae bacterium]MCI0742474.1 Rieske 2Fe-2S domain-containing protein [Gemmataceae bacterium]
MGCLDHWQPVLLARNLGKKPVAVRLCGKDVVLFRTRSGKVAALEDICPHRRMRLSLGSVVGERLRCMYHGWTFDCEGAGESPASPKLYTCAQKYDVLEKHHAIWVKSVGSTPEFPAFEIDGYHNVCNLQHRAQAPLELVVDNFCEIEHTPTTHAFFGYPLERMHEVEVGFYPTDRTVRVVNRGPRKHVSWFLRAVLGIGGNHQFRDEWTTHFSPVYSVYDHWWQDPDSGAESRVRFRLYIFFVPRDDEETTIFTFAYTKSRYWGPAGGARLLGWLMRRKLDYEIRLDVGILNGLADKNPHVEGMKLSRFDRVLGLNRDRINRIYRGFASMGVTGDISEVDAGMPRPKIS